LLRAQDGQSTGATSVCDFMTKNPVAVAIDDDCTVAATAFREYRLKSLPVVEHKKGRKLAGCLRVRRLMAFVIKEMDARSETLEPGAQKPELPQ
jgi:Mg/Co/Ni transporter MgtE